MYLPDEKAIIIAAAILGLSIAVPVIIMRALVITGMWVP